MHAYVHVLELGVENRKGMKSAADIHMLRR